MAGTEVVEVLQTGAMTLTSQGAYTASAASGNTAKMQQGNGYMQITDDGITLYSDSSDYITLNSQGAVTVSSQNSGIITLDSISSTVIESDTEFSVTMAGTEAVEILQSTGAVTIQSPSNGPVKIASESSGGTVDVQAINQVQLQAQGASAITGTLKLTAGKSDAAGTIIMEQMASNVASNRFVIDANGRTTLTHASGEHVVVASDGAATYTAFRVSNHHVVLHKSLTGLGSGANTMLSVTLAALKSAHIRATCTGEWNSLPAIHSGNYFIQHNSGSAPETNQAGYTGILSIESSMGTTASGYSFTVGIAPTSTAAAAKAFEVKYTPVSSTDSTYPSSLECVFVIDGEFSAVS